MATEFEETVSQYLCPSDEPEDSDWISMHLICLY
jgi:hypothetical protein